MHNNNNNNNNNNKTIIIGKCFLLAEISQLHLVDVENRVKKVLVNFCLRNYKKYLCFE